MDESRRTNDWSLEAAMAHWTALRDGDLRHAALARELLEQQVKHQADIADRVAEYNALHFSTLNAHRESTLKDRADFVTHAEYRPFSDQVLEFIAGAQGGTDRSQRTIAVVIAVSGLLFGLVGTGLALIVFFGGA